MNSALAEKWTDDDLLAAEARITSAMDIAQAFYRAMEMAKQVISERRTDRLTQQQAYAEPVTFEGFQKYVKRIAHGDHRLAVQALENAYLIRQTARGFCIDSDTLFNSAELRLYKHLFKIWAVRYTGDSGFQIRINTRED